MHDIDSRGERDAQDQHDGKTGDEPRGHALGNEYAETECSNDECNKEADTYGAPPKRKYGLAQQRLAVEKCGFVGHGGYRSKRSDRVHERLGLPPLHNDLARCSTRVDGVVMPPIYQSNGIECYYEQPDQRDTEQQGNSCACTRKAERAALTARFRRLVTHLVLLFANPAVPDLPGTQVDDEAGST